MELAVICAAAAVLGIFLMIYGEVHQKPAAAGIGVVVTIFSFVFMIYGIQSYIDQATGR